MKHIYICIHKKVCILIRLPDKMKRVFFPTQLNDKLMESHDYYNTSWA